MTALRQEVTLQTRSARRDREQTAETLETLSSVVERLSREPEEEATSPAVDAVHVDVLLELHDALSRAERQASQVIASTVDTLCDWRTRHEIETETDDVSEAMPLAVCAPDATTKASTLRRLRGWFGGAAKPAVEPSTVAGEPTDDAATAAQETAWAEIGAEAGRMADRLEGLVTGYRLSLQRLERILSTCGIEPISCWGQAVDPELMEVVQIVSDSTKPPGMVTDQVRCGYWRHGRVYRFAQVVATR
jgi:molecular chaperone GrpE (heat shock protein)